MLLFADATLDTTAAAQALAKLHVEELLLPVLVQLALIIAVARVAGVLARKVGQPTVVGEVVAGLLLGPSLLGWLLPGVSMLLFKPHFEGVPDVLSQAAFPKVFQVLSQIGLIFLLFLIGLEFEFGHLKAEGKAALAVSICGIVLPFGMGALMAPVIHPHLEAHPVAGIVPLFGLTLFLGVAMSITAIPVLGRIMIELGINRTKLGSIVITAAAIGDAVGWIMLPTVGALSKAAFNPVEAGIMIGQTVLFATGMIFVVRPVLSRYFAWLAKQSGEPLSTVAFTVLLVAILLAAITTNLIGIFAIFGPFLLGAILSDQHEFRDAVTSRMRDIVTTFFVPIFFTYTGLRTEISSVSGVTMWLIMGAVIATGIIGKIGGCAIAARLTGYQWRESAIIGAMMNTRGLMELIVINIGYDLGVIPKSLFCMLVLMAVVTTIMTTPLLLVLRRGTEIEDPIARSGFLATRLT